MRALTRMLAALLGLLVIAGPSGAASRVGIGKMTVTPNRVTAGSTGNEFVFTFTADSAALSGQTLVDVPRSWSLPQTSSPSGPGYVEVQPAGCTSTRITAIVGRRIAIATNCARRHLYRLLYHRVKAALLAADGYVFLTQTRPAGASKKVVFRPLGPRKQPVVRVRGAAPAALFMTATSFATVDVPFSATVRAIDGFGNNAADYTGTVSFTSTDPNATLPGAFTYGAADAAQHTFSGIILRTPGVQRITATDSYGFSVQSGPITVG
jgi:hypothetical protein